MDRLSRAYIRLHHFGFPVRNPKATREFYETILGMPLTACWTEIVEEDFQRFWCMHMFFELMDGAVLGFTAFDRQEDIERYCSNVTPFVHVAIKVKSLDQDRIASLLNKHGFSIDKIFHGYCTSIYVTDPDGLCIEFTADSESHAEIFKTHRQSADSAFTAWMSGERRDNNSWRIPLEMHSRL